MEQDNKILENLKQEKNELIEKRNGLANRKFSTRWKVLYWLGLLAAIGVSIILFYPKLTPLVLLITYGYTVGIPFLSAVNDKRKYNRLSKKIRKLDVEINKYNKELNKNLFEEEKLHQILETPVSPLKVTEETKLEYPEKYIYCGANIRMGKFFINEEYKSPTSKVSSKQSSEDTCKKLVRKKNNKQK